MRLKLVLSSEKELIHLPIHYNATIQGMIYQSLPKLLAKFLHDIGFFYHKRKFKLYTFSKIEAPFKINRNTKRITFQKPIILYISSAIHDITKTIGESFLKKDRIKLGNNFFIFRKIGNFRNTINKRFTYKNKNSFANYNLQNHPKRKGQKILSIF